MELQHSYYFAGLYQDSEELWFTVLDYREVNYELKVVEKIFLTENGASWIKKPLTRRGKKRKKLFSSS